MPLTDDGQEITQQIVPIFRGDAFRMKLHAVKWEMPMLQTHNDTVFCPGSALQHIRAGFGVDDETVVAGGHERIRQTGKHAGIFMKHGTQFAVNGLRGPDDVATIDLTDSLMTEADTQDRDMRSGSPNEIAADTSLGRGAGAWGDDDGFRPENNGLLNSQGIVAAYITFSPEFTEIVNEIEGEAVIIVDQQDHDIMMAFTPPAVKSS